MNLPKALVKWLPESYRAYKSYIQYFSPDQPIFKELSKPQSPIVSIQNIIAAKNQIQLCQKGQKQFLHIGDCAESFQHSKKAILQEKSIFFKQCKFILQQRKRMTVSVFGRIAGQYAKPRSTEFVDINGVSIHNYKGDNVNSLIQSDRNPSEHKLLEGFRKSRETAQQLKQLFPELFYSHEGLILPYEAAQTRNIKGKYFCTSTHMLWIGQRTRQLDGAHLEFFRGIENPVGIKISSKISVDQFRYLIKTLNPKNQLGKLLVIIRMGKDHINSKLDQLISLKKKEGLNFLFVTDPMHGNTYQSKQQHKLKTRDVSHIHEQIKFFESKMIQNKLPYGYSLEATYENVTQCHGFAYPVSQSELKKQNFLSKCDPRLNKRQTKKLLSILNQQ